ncbi:MAG: bifunctional 3-(3-hydroxy-phenyl)propionate/3-hydroxycinnamic acid hydroxylase MhpA [Xanthobacteraceae bacterium]
MYDVVIVGYGPTGMLAAVKLGRAGRKVAVIERYKTLYTLPRVGIVHDDVLRMFQELGISEKLRPATQFLPKYELVNKGRILLSNNVEPNATHGWPEFISIYQPAFEAELDILARSLPNVDILQGQTGISIAQDSDKVSVTVESDGGARRTIEGRYLIGSDGGNSFVRSALGSKFEFLGFDQDWLVIDAKIKRPKELPALRQFCEPDQPGMTMQMGAHHRRWSFMIFPDEPIEHAMKPENVWKRLDRSEGGTPDDFELIRVASYKFTSQIADHWRVGRAFLAGDAAHLMPPFLAQGMCSGFRDAYNLSWKLDAVLSGQADTSLLDTYEMERAPNARATIIESARVGQNVIERDHAKAKQRDAQLLAMQAELEKAKGQKALIAFRVPGFTEGLVAHAGKNVRGAGDAFPQGVVRGDMEEGRFDDVAGGGYLIVARNDHPASTLSPEDLSFWASIGGRFVNFDSRPGTGGLIDVEGRYTKLMDEYGCNILVKRPDYYIFGACPTTKELPALIGDLRAQLQGPALGKPH